MIIDSSAIVAFIRNEPTADRVEAAMLSASPLRISAFTLLETRIVLARHAGDVAVRECDLLLAKLGVRTEPFDEDQAALAFAAYSRYGKGTGHRARLNLGDCAAYALAMTHHEPLLYVGTDFARTDVTPAI